MGNPNDDYTNPVFSGEVWVTVCVTYDDHECHDQETLESETVELIRSKLSTLGGVYANFEDSDLVITNAEEDYLDKADRLYEQQNDK
jgi:hypothetical protein